MKTKAVIMYAKTHYHLIIITLMCLLPYDAISSQLVGQVLAKQGNVTITSQGKVIKAKRKSALIEQDIITTDTKAKASIKFNDGTLTTLGNNSQMTITKYNWAEGSKRPVAEFELVKGVFRTVTGVITKVKNPSYQVNTPMGSIGIRGTDFWGGYLNDDAVDVLFVGGEHEIVVSNEFGTTVLTEPGQGTTIKAGKAPSPAKVWPQSKVNRAVKTITF